MFLWAIYIAQRGVQDPAPAYIARCGDQNYTINISATALPACQRAGLHRGLSLLRNGEG